MSGSLSGSHKYQTQFEYGNQLNTNEKPMLVSKNFLKRTVVITFFFKTSFPAQNEVDTKLLLEMTKSYSGEAKKKDQKSKIQLKSNAETPCSLTRKYFHDFD